MEVVCEERHLQIGCYRAGEETAEVGMKVRKESLFLLVVFKNEIIISVFGFGTETGIYE